MDGIKLWGNEMKDAIPEMDYKIFINTDEGLFWSLSQLATYGIFFLTNAPLEKGLVGKVAERIGTPRDTFYGRVWDIEVVPSAKNIAYTSLMLPLHQDLLYFESVPGIQLLHCLSFRVQGGETFFVDGFRVAELLRDAHPHAYEILSTIPVTYSYNQSGQSMKFKRPVLNLSSRWTHSLSFFDAVFYSPPFRGVLEIEEDQIEQFYEAYDKFRQITERKELKLMRTLREGDIVLFNNRRLLHGRNSFVGFPRHLQGTYVDIDYFRSRLLYLRSQLRLSKF